MAGPKAIKAKGTKPGAVKGTKPRANTGAKPGAKKKAPTKAAAKNPRPVRAKAKPKKARTKASAKVRTKVPGKAVDQVVAAAKSIKKSAKAKPSKAEHAVFAELERLSDYIQAAKLEIAQIRPDDVKDEHLPTAIDELDAVVQAAADATNSIMDACEIVETVMGDVPAEASGKLMDATTRIYEACTFQDITGQRINKVVTTMRHIEDCIDALLDAFGDKPANAKKKARAPKKTAASKPNPKKVLTDEDLLDGPQLGEKVKSQSEIDDLFASFD